MGSKKETKKYQLNAKKHKKAKEVKQHIEEPTSIFRKRRKFDLNDNFLVSTEESERRLQAGCIGLAIPLVIACSIITFLYGGTLQVNLPTILKPNIREHQDHSKFQTVFIIWFDLDLHVLKDLALSLSISKV